MFQWLAVWIQHTNQYQHQELDHLQTYQGSPLDHLLRVGNRSTNKTTTTLLIGHPMLYERFKLRAQIRHMERLLSNNGRCLVRRSTAVPAQAVFVLIDGDVRLKQRDPIARKIGRILLYIPIAATGRTRSITIPTVSAKRTGLWGVLPVHVPHDRITRGVELDARNDRSTRQCSDGCLGARTYLGAGTSRPP